MHIVVGICAGLQILAAVVVYTFGVSAQHETTAAVLFGLGVVAFALGVLIENTQKIIRAMKS